tara:strand:+ start:1027 stop:1275 length:249 start_codon:yes stop_codon:yes gene_type:complete
MGLMSDHQDSNSFSYSRTWVEIEGMLEDAEKRMNEHQVNLLFYKNKNRKKAMYHARNFKALQGVVKTLRWTLGDKNISHPLE